MKSHRTCALIVAAGRGVRVGGAVPKQYRLLSGRPVIARAVDAFRHHQATDDIRVVIAAGDEAAYAAALGPEAPPALHGGTTRQSSVRAGLESIAADGGCERVLIHDAARPLVPASVIDRVLGALDDADGATPALPIVDSVRTGALHVDGEVPRERTWRVQTPQGFRFDAILDAHRRCAREVTDDVAVARMAGLTVALVAGDEAAMKLTTADDFARAEALLARMMVPRAAMGYDVHSFGPGDHLWLCGVRIEHSAGLVGHSDADVGLHALTDALLGTIAAGDIGQHFPPSDDRWRGASSDRFLAHASGLVRAAGGIIDHVDLTIICERPKVGPHRAAMQGRVAAMLGLHATQVSIKATTTEGLGFTGRREGIAAQAVASVRLPLTETMT